MAKRNRPLSDTQKIKFTDLLIEATLTPDQVRKIIHLSKAGNQQITFNMAREGSKTLSLFEGAEKGVPCSNPNTREDIVYGRF